MQARGPLMIEHRLIERMISLIRVALPEIESTRRVDPVFIDAAVDFIRVYADRTHHGKEEDILFRELETRSLSDEHRRIMNELVDEHIFGRQTTKALVEANERYRSGDKSALNGIVESLKTLCGFYPEHIAKEDKIFFPSTRVYFTNEEEQALLAEFSEFDRKMIHEVFTAKIERLEKEMSREAIGNNPRNAE
ncbi:MAG TPA: cation-binding protein [Deltaproteobacteria bacterium]|nr:cation-binding protein [Deltaproteobacteria bacterium]